MPGPTTEVLSDDMKGLREDIHKLDVGQAEIRTTLKILVGLAKWGLTLIVTTLIASAISGIWWASGLTSEVRHLDGQVQEVRKLVPARLNRISPDPTDSSVSSLPEPRRPGRAGPP